jgi:hypothetical protein
MLGIIISPKSLFLGGKNMVKIYRCICVRKKFRNKNILKNQTIEAYKEGT